MFWCFGVFSVRKENGILFLNFPAVRYQRDYELEKLQADIRRRREEVEQLRLQSLRDDGLPDNINSLWDRFNKVMTGSDSTLSEGTWTISWFQYPRQKEDWIYTRKCTCVLNEYLRTHFFWGGGLLRKHSRKRFEKVHWMSAQRFQRVWSIYFIFIAASMDESTISSSSLDMDRLKDLLKNPGKYLLRHLRENPQLATSFTVPLGTFTIVSFPIKWTSGFRQ